MPDDRIDMALQLNGDRHSRVPGHDLRVGQEVGRSGVTGGCSCGWEGPRRSGRDGGHRVVDDHQQHLRDQLAAPGRPGGSDAPIVAVLRTPQRFQAWQVTEHNARAVADWCGGMYCDDGEICVIDDHDAPGFAAAGDWVIRRGDTTFSDSASVLDNDTFQRHYRPEP